MLTYFQILSYLLLPPIVVLAALYWPVLGRRDGIKIAWLCCMATIWTTPWDNWILSRQGWGYPPGSIIGRIWLVPIEEHLFFLLQPVFLVLLHSIITHPLLLPFATISRFGPSTGSRGPNDVKLPAPASRLKLVQTLPKRPGAALVWLTMAAIGAMLVHEAHGLAILPSLGLEGRAFYLGWILLWICPVIAFVTFLGTRCGRADMLALVTGTAWLWITDTVAIRAGAWSISSAVTLGIQLWPGLPLEEAVFFLLVSNLIIATCSIMSHLHTLLILCPDLPACPPRNPLAHIALLARVALDPPLVDVALLHGLRLAEETLRAGSKSFEVAKLAFGREMRITLVAIYAWCRVTDDLIDESPTAGSSSDNRFQTLQLVRRHLEAAFSGQETDAVLDGIPNLSESQRSAFYVFAAIVPRFSIAEPFLELCRGYETDLKFLPAGFFFRAGDASIENHLPIKTSEDLLQYADDVAGSIATAICYAAYSILVDPWNQAHATQPVLGLGWAKSLHIPSGQEGALARLNGRTLARAQTVVKAREMGRALQLVNIARDIAKDAKINRLYIPLSSFSSAPELLDFLAPRSTAPDYARYNLPLLDTAELLRQASHPAISHLPRTARGGTRAMVASYFQISEAIRLADGSIDERGIRVEKGKRLRAAALAMWGFG